MLWLAALALVQDQIVTRYVEKLCQKLTPGVAVAVVVDSKARAGAFPDGSIRINSAMIAGAQNEAQLAGILAHEIAHSRPHPGQVHTEDEDSGLCLRFAHAEPEDPNAKEWEHDADQAAIAMLVKAGYDPLAMLRYFSILRHASPDLPRAFSAEDILIEGLQLEATDHPMKDPVIDTSEFRTVRERIK